VNEIEEFENGNKKEARRIIQGNDNKIGLKKATDDVGAHLILLGQLNQDGKTIKGGTSLPHLVDIALNVVKTDTNGMFRVEVGTKHRYGSTENIAMFKHTEEGVIEHSIEEMERRERLREWGCTEESMDKLDAFYRLPKEEQERQTEIYCAEQRERIRQENIQAQKQAQIQAQHDYDAPNPNNFAGWSNRQQDHYEKTVAEAVKRGEIKLDQYGNIIPKDKRSILTKLNQVTGKLFGL
jgi:hypothetical protein